MYIYFIMSSIGVALSFIIYFGYKQHYKNLTTKIEECQEEKLFVQSNIHNHSEEIDYLHNKEKSIENNLVKFISQKIITYCKINETFTTKAIKKTRSLFDKYVDNEETKHKIYDNIKEFIDTSILDNYSDNSDTDSDIDCTEIEKNVIHNYTFSTSDDQEKDIEENLNKDNENHDNKDHEDYDQDEEDNEDHDNKNNEDQNEEDQDDEDKDSEENSNLSNSVICIDNEEKPLMNFDNENISV